MVQQDDPWVLWQEIDVPGVGGYRCSGCGKEKTGKRFVAMSGKNGSFSPAQARGRQGFASMPSRLVGAILCPDCRYRKVEAPEKPRRRKTTLD